MRYTKLALLIFCISIMQTARANVVWPALYICESFWSVVAIIAGLVVETGFIKHFTEASWMKSILTSVTMNICTLIVGCIAIAMCGLGIESLFFIIDTMMNITTFHISHWLVNYIAAVVINTLIESGVIYLMMRKPLKETYTWLLIANAISAAICCIYMYFYNPQPVYF